MPQALTQKRLQELLQYDPSTGAFTWAVTAGRCRSGDRAGRVNVKGYREIRIDGVLYYAHRLVWLYVNGEWPPEFIDHADGDKSNNAIGNLRPASRSENAANMRAHQDNASGLKGVFWCRRRSKWVSTITQGGKAIHLGSFASPEEAHRAYALKAAELFGPFARAA